MPDLTIEVMQMCASIDGPRHFTFPSKSGNGTYEVTGMFHERTQPSCTCWPFKKAYAAWRKAPMSAPIPSCRHIEEAERSVCGWHQQWAMDVSQTAEQREKQICPRCGGSTVLVRVGV